MPITNQQVTGHALLRQMYDDSHFPDRAVDGGRAILLRLCERIEAEQPSDLEALYALTQAATEEFNLLDKEFVAAGSGIEAVAREWISPWRHPRGATGRCSWWPPSRAPA